jgi:BMFP domain-containing protein YqiC
MNCTKSERLDELRDKIRSLLPEDVHRLGEDVKRNTRLLFESAYGRLNLVTRDDLELVRSTLQETRRMLESLERRLDELETRTTTSGHGGRRPPSPPSS